LIGGVQALRALRVQAKALFVELHRVIEVELRILELVGDRFEPLQRGLDRSVAVIDGARDLLDDRTTGRSGWR